MGLLLQDGIELGGRGDGAVQLSHLAAEGLSEQLVDQELFVGRADQEQFLYEATPNIRSNSTGPHTSPQRASTSRRSASGPHRSDHASTSSAMPHAPISG